MTSQGTNRDQTTKENYKSAVQNKTKGKTDAG